MKMKNLGVRLIIAASIITILLAVNILPEVAYAALTTIGTVQLSETGPEYYLIWDNDNNGNSLVWLDYSFGVYGQLACKAWADELNTSRIFKYSIDPAYAVIWEGSWRLPDAGANPTQDLNQTSSEMGDLYYNDLSLTANPSPPNPVEVLNATNFDHLIPTAYWTGTDYADHVGNAWLFGTTDGYQIYKPIEFSCYALAVRSGQVSMVPVPGAIWLLGSGLIGIAGIRRKFKK